jgi:hypothetical protein
MAINDLCLNVYFENDIIGPYNFQYSGITNGKNYWHSTGSSMTIIWNLSNKYWEVLNWTGVTNTALRSVNSSDIPTSDWKIRGVAPKNDVLVTYGECDGYSPILLRSKITNNSCVGNCDGVIVASSLGGIKPYVYSINNGQTYSSSPIFKGICEGQYNLYVSGQTGGVASIVSNVSSENELSRYEINLSNISEQFISDDTIQTTWKLNINPELKAGHVLTLTMNANLETSLYQPGSASTNNIISVYKNNSLLTPNIISNSLATNRPYCSPNLINTTYSALTYSTTIISGDTLTGTTTSIINNNGYQVDSNGCSTKVEQKNTIRIDSAKINTCRCCEIIFNSQNYVGINSHIK